MIAKGYRKKFEVVESIHFHAK